MKVLRFYGWGSFRWYGLGFFGSTQLSYNSGEVFKRSGPKFLTTKVTFLRYQGLFWSQLAFYWLNFMIGGYFLWSRRPPFEIATLFSFRGAFLTFLSTFIKNQDQYFLFQRRAFCFLLFRATFITFAEHSPTFIKITITF